MSRLSDQYNAIIAFCKKRTEIAKTNGISLSWVEPINMEIDFRINEKGEFLIIKALFTTGSKYIWKLERIAQNILRLSLNNCTVGFNVVSSVDHDLSDVDGVDVAVIRYIIETIHNLTVERIK